MQVTGLNAQQVTTDSWSGLVGSLPALEVMGDDYIYLSNPDADIAQISLGLRNTGTSLTRILLYMEGMRANA